MLTVWLGCLESSIRVHLHTPPWPLYHQQHHHPCRARHTASGWSLGTGEAASPLSSFYKEEPQAHREKTMAPHSSTLAWKIPWTDKPGGPQSMGSWRVGHNWATSFSLFTFMHWRRKQQPTPVFLPGEPQGRGSLVGCRLWGRSELATTEGLGSGSRPTEVIQLAKGWPSHSICHLPLTLCPQQTLIINHHISPPLAARATTLLTYSSCSLTSPPHPPVPS